jgi:hypothetical protein
MLSFPTPEDSNIEPSLQRNCQALIAVIEHALGRVQKLIVASP